MQIKIRNNYKIAKLSEEIFNTQLDCVDCK